MSYIPGKLKLKGAPLPVANAGVKKQQRKSNTITSEKLVASVAATQPDNNADIVLPEDPRTPAQIAYEKAMAKREKQRVKQMATQSHREKLENFNKKLANMTDIHDIPKVDPRNQ